MIRAIWTATTGMKAQQLNIDIISNNLANVNTTGFKRSRADFQDLIYQSLKNAGTPSSAVSEEPTGIQVGLGVKPAAVQKIFSQGDYLQTQNELDLAIEGEGFFQVLKPNGEISYTRAGAFKINSEGEIVTSDGYPMEPSITIPSDTLGISVGSDGIVSVIQAEQSAATEVGTIELVKFTNPSGLKSIGKNLYLPTDASGDEITGTPGEEGFGTITQGFLEMSNVSVVEEMVNMIIAQRAYEINSKAIQAADDMLQMANNLRR